MVIKKMLRERATLISEQEFVDGLVEASGGKLTSTNGWRQYLNDIYIANPPQKNFVNPFAKKVPIKLS